MNDESRDPIGKVCVGAIAGAFGVRGEARLKSFCADAEAISDYAPLTDRDGREYDVRLTRAVKGGFSARLSGVTTREQAEALKGVRLYAPRHKLPTLPTDEFYHADLIGLPVYDGGGVKLGKVRAVHDFGAGDILEIVDPSLRQPAMLPFTREAVPIVDLAAHRIVADPPAGVFPGDDQDDEAEAAAAEEKDDAPDEEPPPADASATRERSGE